MEKAKDLGDTRQQGQLDRERDSMSYSGEGEGSERQEATGTAR